MQGDTMIFKGKVTDKYVKDGRHYVDAEVWVENARESSPATFCKASAILPSRGQDCIVPGVARPQLAADRFPPEV